MSDIVPADQIERIVGAPRHHMLHLARAVSSEQTVYILHSRICTAMEPDLRDCRFSIALDWGIDLDVWADYLDQVVSVAITQGHLVPIRLFYNRDTFALPADEPGMCPFCGQPFQAHGPDCEFKEHRE